MNESDEKGCSHSVSVNARSQSNLGLVPGVRVMKRLNYVLYLHIGGLNMFKVKF